MKSFKKRCEACFRQRRHTEREMEVFHPEAGGGYTKEHGWTDNILANRRTGGLLSSTQEQKRKDQSIREAAVEGRR